jgi:hypothetical protein
MKPKIDTNLPRMAGFGPVAWGGETQETRSMHPPIPGHIEFVEEEMQTHAEHHHIVHRRHPENDNEISLIRMEITPEDMGYHPHHRHYFMHNHKQKKGRGRAATKREHNHVQEYIT